MGLADGLPNRPMHNAVASGLASITNASTKHRYVAALRSLAPDTRANRPAIRRKIQSGLAHCPMDAPAHPRHAQPRRHANRALALVATSPSTHQPDGTATIDNGLARSTKDAKPEMYFAHKAPRSMAHRALATA